MKMRDALKRTWLEITLLILIGWVLFVFPETLTTPGSQLLLYKVMLFSASQLHAMVLRKWFFPYIDVEALLKDLRYGREPMNMMALGLIIALHVSSAYVYAQGG